MSNYKLHQFHGGVKFKNEHKITDPVIHTIAEPKIFIVPMQQHIGKSATPLVAKGDLVKKYQMIASVPTGLGAPVHAPCSGRVTKIGSMQKSGAKGDVYIHIEPDGADNIDLMTPCANNNGALLERIGHSGLVGMGGAGFPSFFKMSGRRNIDYLIINASECEPYISCDDALMQNEPEKIIQGIAILQKLLKPTHTIIGIEENKIHAKVALDKYADASMAVVQIPSLYPSGGEKQLIKILTNVSLGKNDVPENMVCFNIATIFGIYRALIEGVPLIERVVSITGAACQSPSNYWLKIGTPLTHVLQETGVDLDANIISGGPMMGRTINPKNHVLAKTNNCFIASKNNDKSEVSECIRCGQCHTVCPMMLLPQQLYWYRDDLTKAQIYNVENCIECGCCDYVCPSNIPLVNYFVQTKMDIRLSNAKRQKSDYAKVRHEKREARLVRLEEQRQAKLAKQRADIQVKIADKKAQEVSNDSNEETVNLVVDKAAIIAAAQKKVSDKKP